MILDIVLVVLVLINVVYGYKKGCVKVIFRLISVVVAFGIAYMLAKSVGTYIWNNTPIGDKIEVTITNTIQNYSHDNLEPENIGINTIIENGIESGKLAVVSKVREYGICIIGFVVTFIGARLALLIVQLIINGVFELPILKTFNKIGGIVVAIIIFMIELSVLLAIINFTSSFEFVKPVVAVINNSLIVKVLYEHNIVTNIILNKII